MEDEAWMFGDPFQDVGVLVSGIVIDDDMSSLFLGTLVSMTLRKRMDS